MNIKDFNIMYEKHNKLWSTQMLFIQKFVIILVTVWTKCCMRSNVALITTNKFQSG